jgi:hypothetical protein
VAAKRGFERGGIELRGMDRRWDDVLRHRSTEHLRGCGRWAQGG